MRPPILDLMIERLRGQLAEGDPLVLEFAVWLGVYRDERMSEGDVSGIWLAREVARAALREASARSTARPFRTGLAALRCREFFVPHSPGLFESDPIAILAVAIGTRHIRDQEARKWIADIATRAMEAETDPWRVGLLVAAAHFGGKEGALPLPAELALVVASRLGIPVDRVATEDALTRALTLDETTPEQAAVRLAALYSLTGRGSVAGLGPVRGIATAGSSVRATPPSAPKGDDVNNRATPAPTIGILTALPKESAAMRLMLENEVRFAASGEGAGRDYYLGIIPDDRGGAHEVVLALLPDMANNAAAISATRLLGHFPSVRHIIMCGIAGGVPRPGDAEHDVRLGDIVVSNRNGVIQYDLIKERPDGSREHRYPPRPPGAELLDAVRHMRTEEELGRLPWAPFLARGASMKNGIRPPDDTGARGESVVYPLDRERVPGQPRVFHAPIAAANILLTNAEHRDYLAATFGVKAIEMEGSGVADAAWTSGAGYLVVRGVCDYCDGSKGDAWQGAAAIAAAAYTRAVIGSMSATVASIPPFA